MRLIDADARIEELKNSVNGQNVNWSRTLFFHEMVDNMVDVLNDTPTAYDVDRVVDELCGCETTVEDIIDKDDCIYPLDWYKGALYAYKDAINIVGRGGIDD